MKNFITMFCVAIIGAGATTAQEFNNNGTNKLRRFGYSASYYSIKSSSFGWQLGVENYLATTKNYQVIGSLNLSNYSVESVYTAVTLNPRIGFRYTSNFGFVLENAIGFGYLHRFYKYNDYGVNANGDVVSKRKASQGSAMPNFMLGAGFNLENKFKIPLLAVVRGSLNYNYPNRHFIFETYFSLEAGLVFRPNFKK